MIYRFGAFNLDSEMFELHRNGEAVAIEPQVFNVLVHLIENRDRIVAKDELINVVWHGRAVSDATLSSRIYSLRQAVGDDGELQNVIRTVSRRGFRFVAEVACGRENAVVDAADAESNRDRNPSTPETTNNFALPVNAVACATSEPVQKTLMPTLAVLPFKINSEGLGEYFCDGLTEDLISNLTHFRELRVIASGSSVHFKSRETPLSEIAAKLGAQYFVDGSVRREGDRLRVAVQLIEASSGVSLWADRYDRQLEDIFAVQDSITHMIAASLGVRMQDTALARALRKSPSEMDAYDCLLRARRYTATLNESMHAEARDLLETAIAIDPMYAEAHALLSNVYLAEHRFGANPRSNPIERALSMALKATHLDPQSAYAHCWLAIVHFFQKDNGKFETEARRALDLNPNDPEILAEMGHYLSFMGEYQRGTELSKRAQQLNPLHPGWYHFSAARLHYHQRRYKDVLRDVQQISMPQFYWTHLLNAAALGQLGDGSAAHSLAMMKKVKPEMSARVEIEKWNATPEDLAQLIEGLRKAGQDE